MGCSEADRSREGPPRPGPDPGPPLTPASLAGTEAPPALQAAAEKSGSHRARNPEVSVGA